MVSFSYSTTTRIKTDGIFKSSSLLPIKRLMRHPCSEKSPLKTVKETGSLFFLKSNLPSFSSVTLMVNLAVIDGSLVGHSKRHKHKARVGLLSQKSCWIFRPHLMLSSLSAWKRGESKLSFRLPGHLRVF